MVEECIDGETLTQTFRRRRRRARAGLRAGRRAPLWPFWIVGATFLFSCLGSVMILKEGQAKP